MQLRLGHDYGTTPDLHLTLLDTTNDAGEDEREKGAEKDYMLSLYWPMEYRPITHRMLDVLPPYIYMFCSGGYILWANSRGSFITELDSSTICPFHTKKVSAGGFTISPETRTSIR